MLNNKNSLSIYKDKVVSKKLAVSIVIKFAKQECIFHELLEEIRRFKPYQKGNDDARYLVNYLVGVTTSASGCLDWMFCLLRSTCDTENYEKWKSETEKWDKINDKWKNVVGRLRIYSSFFES